jgi:hypothetical protein
MAEWIMKEVIGSSENSIVISAGHSSAVSCEASSLQCPRIIQLDVRAKAAARTEPKTFSDDKFELRVRFESSL